MNSSIRNDAIRAVVGGAGMGTAGVGLVKRQRGGHGQFAKVEISVRAASDPNSANIVESAVVGGTIPAGYLSAAVDGCQEGLKRGPVGGYPVTGVIVTILGGEVHEKDSDPGAFEEAGQLAILDALGRATMTLMEPLAMLDVSVPSEYFGALLGDIARRRGQVIDTDGDGTFSRVRASVPLAEMFGYATDLRSMTQGRGEFTMEPSGYAAV